MTTTTPAQSTLDLAGCRALPENTMVTVSDSSGVVETLRVMRYGGFYRDAGVHTFAVKSETGKFSIRSEKQLGLGGQHGRTCAIADSAAIDLTDAALNMP